MMIAGKNGETEANQLKDIQEIQLVHLSMEDEGEQLRKLPRFLAWETGWLVIPLSKAWNIGRGEDLQREEDELTFMYI